MKDRKENIGKVLKVWLAKGTDAELLQRIGQIRDVHDRLEYGECYHVYDERYKELDFFRIEDVHNPENDFVIEDN